MIDKSKNDNIVLQGLNVCQYNAYENYNIKVSTGQYDYYSPRVVIKINSVDYER